MLRKLVYVGVLVAVVLGVRALIEREATRMLGVAQEMYEDGEYDRALGVVREIEQYFGWTDACDRSMALREEIREAMKRQREQRELEEWSRKTQREHEQWIEREDEHRQKMEEAKKQRDALFSTPKKRTPVPTPQPTPRRKFYY